MRQNYLAGKAKRQHSDTPILDTTLEEDEVMLPLVQVVLA